MTADEHNGPDPSGRPDVLGMIDAVALRHADERLDDIARPTTAALSAGDRAAWHTWHQARSGPLRALHRAQRRCGTAAAGFAIIAWLSAISDDAEGARTVETGIAWAAAVALGCVVLFAELSMSMHAGFLPFPTRVRLHLKARERVNLQPLRDSAAEELIGGSRADAARLMAISRDCVASITGSAHWRSGRLDELAVRCDLNQVLTVIARGAAEFQRARAGGSPGGAGAMTSGPLETGSTVPGWNALVDRVTWLRRYHDQLRTLMTERVAGLEPSTRRPAPILVELRFTVLALTWLDDVG